MTATVQPGPAAAKRAALYLRVSTGRQAEQDLSIPDQRRQAHAYCQARGYIAAAEFVEAGASATDDRRPEFQKMMDAAAAKPPTFDTIIVHSFSRFFRDQFQLEFYVRRLAKNGVRLVSITQDLGEDPMSVMMRQIMALFDEYQSKENAKHTLRAMQENARQGFWNGSRPPFGYRVVAAEQRGARTKKKLEVDPAQAEHVRLMFRLVRIGDGERGPLGANLIADYLNQKGIRTSGGGRWGVGAVHQILTRTTYVGEHRFNVYSWRKREEKPEDEIVTVAVPAILEREEFDEAQAIMRSRAPQLKAPRFVSSGTTLGGICFCADCGGAMTLRTGGKGEGYRYYTCCTKARQGKTGCKGRTIPTDRLDAIVIEHIENRLLAPDRVVELLNGVLERRTKQAEDYRESIARLRRQAADADAKLTRLYDAIENGLADAGDENLKGRLKELRTVRDAARSDADRAEARAGDRSSEITEDAIRRFAGEAKRRMRTADGGYRRHHLQALAQRIEVGDATIRITGTKSKLLRVLAGGEAGPPHLGAGHSSRSAGLVVETTANEVRTFVPNWLRG
jgi:site-specific DNA recombinase